MLVARLERTGRSMSDLRWYQALALWKAAVFMEGNYKRSLAGTTDDPFRNDPFMPGGIGLLAGISRSL